MATATATKKKTARRNSAPRRDVNQEVTDRIIEAMEAGTLPWRPQYCVTEGDQLPTNQLTGKAYRGVNVMLLWIAAGMGDFNGNRWMTYKQAEGLGAQVRRGEKGTRIVYYGQIGEKNEESAKQEDQKSGRFYLKGYTVFNVAQIDGLDLPEFDPNDRLEFEPEEAAEKVVDGFFERDGAPTLHYRQCTPCYVPALDAVKMPPRNRLGQRARVLSHPLPRTGSRNGTRQPSEPARDRGRRSKRQGKVCRRGDGCGAGCLAGVGPDRPR